MKKRRIELSLLLITLLLLPAISFAQDDMTFGEDEVEKTGEDMTFGEGDDQAATTDDGAAAKDTGNSDDDLIDLDDLGMGVGGDVAVGEPTAKNGEKKPEGATVLDRHPIWAVQQVYALRKHRLDLQPSFGISLNDPYVQHQSFNVDASFYLTEVLAIGVNFNWYTFFNAETDVNYQISRATHQTVPINEYSWGAQLNMKYVPLYGKFAMFKQWILHWDVWLVGGAGFLYTRPIPVIDQEYRTFDYDIKVAFNVGIGGRLYLTRFLAIFLELRDYIFPENVESIVTYQDPALRKDKKTWMDPNVKLTNNVMLQVGISLFVPFTFDFKLPK
ncbi:MAG: outer membrane beta-barrel domain-containing protein [Deltaproteobacteria bacterium]|nr:outer membrane beta-barrel domain-containing protein [Deltaproteobacteria bacterium]